MFVSGSHNLTHTANTAVQCVYIKAWHRVKHSSKHIYIDAQPMTNEIATKHCVKLIGAHSFVSSQVKFTHPLENYERTFFFKGLDSTKNYFN